MSKPLDLQSFDQYMRDAFPLPGTRLKQYVVDLRREHAWECETCPCVNVAAHDDNTGVRCRNEGPTPWTYLDHDCCEVCGMRHLYERKRPEIQAWLAEKAARPPICADRTKFSDEVEPDWHLAPNPLLARDRK